MEIFKTKNLNFTYPEGKNKAVDNVNITIKKGEFVCLCGQSGCGKTTLLKLLKKMIAPSGVLSGEIYFSGQPLEAVTPQEQVAKIGFVMQDVESQIVTDKVWHELAFGLESLGYEAYEIRKRIAETASFFNIEEWFNKNVDELSGGQKQLLNLASVMVMKPEVLILDEPTAQLDPIASSEFLNNLKKINDELGTTIILSEHRLEEMFSISERVLVMDSGKIIADGTPRNIGKFLKDINHPMFKALPTPARIYGSLTDSGDYPITVKEGRLWLEKIAENKEIKIIQNQCDNDVGAPCIRLKDVWFRYEKKLPDVLRGINLTVNRGEILSILGGNGSGKTTLLAVISAIKKHYRGEVCINGERINKVKNLYTEILGVLPQNPKSIFVKNTVLEDFKDIEKSQETIEYFAGLCKVQDLYERHPYDLSGGEQQRVALCKVLLKDPQILLLDEPTKGLDAYFKEIFGKILKTLKSQGKTIVMVSHDIEFCAYVSDRCSMIFDGVAVATLPSRKFFCGNTFYTTATNRMSRNVCDNAFLIEDIILAFDSNEE